jgi:hypothetical protein
MTRRYVFVAAQTKTKRRRRRKPSPTVVYFDGVPAADWGFVKVSL